MTFELKVPRKFQKLQLSSSSQGISPLIRPKEDTPKDDNQKKDFPQDGFKN